MSDDAFEGVMLGLLFELASRPGPLSDVERRDLGSAEAWLRRNADGSRRPTVEGWETVAVLEQVSPEQLASAPLER